MQFNWLSYSFTNLYVWAWPACFSVTKYTPEVKASFTETVTLFSLTVNPLLKISLPAISTIFTSTRSPFNLGARSEEHTSELQSRENLVCRLLLEKKKKHQQIQLHK